MTKKDAIIVGQGIAGTLLAYEMERRGLDFQIIDRGSGESASAISSGLINPITGRRYVKSWMIEDLLSAARKSYESLETMLGHTLIKEFRIVRTLTSVKAENLWETQLLKPGYGQFMQGNYNGPNYGSFIQNIGTCNLVVGALRIDVSRLLSYSRSRLNRLGRLSHEPFDFKNLHLKPGGVRYRDITSDHIFFAEGWRVVVNPLFKHLPFRPAKGDVLICRIPGFPDKDIIKHHKFIVPLGENVFWVGSNYRWDFWNEQPEAKGRKDLEKFLYSALKVSYEVLDHKAGVRPATKYRRPFVGTHPDYPSVHILNGLGTKGISLAPYWASALVSSIFDSNYSNPRFKELPSL